MKKVMYFLATTAMCLFLCTGCENSGGKTTKNSVLKKLPGTWKVDKIVDEDGSETDYNGEAIFVFGKQESENDYSQNNSSSLWGYCSITIDGIKILTKGTWNIEPDDEDKGVFFYIQQSSSNISFGGNAYYMITDISGSSMRWEETDNRSGYILSRVE